MGKSLFIAEKPSVAQEFAKALKVNTARKDGYLEGDDAIITWCVGHLVTMSYPEVYDEKYKKWSLATLPFLPEKFLYEVIPGVAKQFKIVSGLLNRRDVETIYVCTDSGREGEYIYRLVEQEAGVNRQEKKRRRVWIDSQTEEEILRGIRTAKDLSEYDHLADAAYLRAKEDYLMGINFSRLLTLRYGNAISNYLSTRYTVISVGRVMTCVLGMVVRREREIRQFVKTPFYRVVSQMNVAGKSLQSGTDAAGKSLQSGTDAAGKSRQGGTDAAGNLPESQAGAAGNLLEGEFRAVEGSAYFQSPKLYKENGFKKREDAEALIAALRAGAPDTAGIGTAADTSAATGAGIMAGAGMPESTDAAASAGTAAGTQFPMQAVVQEIERKRENKNPPLLFNLAELQNECSKLFKISPDETLRTVQELYEKKLVTYPRTDARVLSSAVAKEIQKNIRGLTGFEPVGAFAREVLENGSASGIARTRYVDDKQITDHYAIVPTGQGLGGLGRLSELSRKVYELIARRFLSIFYPAAVYRKVSLVTAIGRERFFSTLRVLEKEGYLKVAGTKNAKEEQFDPAFLEALNKLKKGARLPVEKLEIKEGETSPPKRYNSGSMILAMENAGQLIEDEELREQIRGSGIGTSATRAEILKKLVANKYLSLNKKTQILTPTLLGEMIFDVVNLSIRSLLNPELTASWEKGLTYVAEGTITPEEYMTKLDHFIRSRTDGVLRVNQHANLRGFFDEAAKYYKKPAGAASAKNGAASAKSGADGK